jgi:murein L,D-transpeptidase YcbB/YkuD
VTNPRKRLALASRLAAAALVAAAGAATLPVSAAHAQTSAVRGDSVSSFYAARAGRPLWLGQAGAPEALIQVLNSAGVDGLNPRRYRTGVLQRAVRSARSGNPAAVRNAEFMLSQALVDYARDLKRLPSRTIYVDKEVDPTRQSPRAILDAAGTASSLERYVRNMGWMHPLYGQLRTAFLTTPNAMVRQRLLTNLRRARELPNYGGRHVLVNSAAQRLYMYDNGEVVDHMRVVAGKPAQPTPMMAALIRFTSVNPYWNVPTDIAANTLAPNVLKNGLGYLKQKGYQVIEGGGDNPRIINPATIDWKAVAAGRQQVYMRQLPGPANSMGNMKFMFPNKEGIYLHDSPRDELFDEAARLLSAGCVRLQDADRLARWLYGKPLKAQGRRPEQRVDLPSPVPVLLTYLTAVPSGTGVAYFDDHYGWDRTALAQR